MFTGIIESVGTVVSIETHGGDVRLYVRSTELDWSDVALGDSIATSGVCLTAVQLPGDGFMADVSFDLNIVPHTLEKTVIDEYRPGSQVNLEVDVIARYLERLLMGDNTVQSVDSATDITREFLVDNGYPHS